jgi:LEA14-like dessication related protein
VKTLLVVSIIAVIIIGIVIGLIAYSYTQVKISLESISYQGLDVSLSLGSISKALINGALGNWLGAVLDVVTGVKLGLGFVLSNHGLVPVYIPSVSYDLLANDIKIGQGQSNIDKTINPGATASILDTQDIKFDSIKPAVASIVESGGTIDFKISGTAYFNFLGLSIPVPFEATKQVNVVDELKSHIFGNSQNSAYSNNSYQSPVTGTNIGIQASSYSVTQGQMVTFSGRLVDSNGNGISNQLVYVKRDISFSPDLVLGSAYTNSNGQFSTTWQAVKPITSNTANIYATFEGGSGYSNARSNDITIQVYQYQNSNPPVPQSQQSVQKTQLVPSNQLTAQIHNFPVANSVYQVPPGTYTSIPFNMQCSGTLIGQFSAQASLGNNIIVYVLDPTSFRQFQSGISTQTYYNSGKTSSGTINIGLPPGQYYLVLSNTYSLVSTKNVNLIASYTCS